MDNMREGVAVNEVIQFDHMRVGAKGGGKHWTKAEVEKRKAAGQKFERKKPIRLKIPVWLGEEAAEVWKKTVKDLKDFDILDNVDEEVLANYCDTVVKVRELNFIIGNEGFTVENAQGVPSPSPHVKIAQGYQRLILQYADKLGITASSRARLAKKIADGKGPGQDGGTDDFFD